ncbi:MAG: InlB B-repeat-containing protein [Clostridia bacterium]|nr:InlB B-repeat-containing protein [Clostridia bacterium]
MFKNIRSSLAFLMVITLIFTNIPLFAIAAEDQLCTISFKPILNVSDPPEAMTVISGTRVQIPLNTPETEGYAFIGWNESGEPTDSYYIPGQYITVYTDMLLRGVWRSSTGDGQYPTSGGYYSVYYSANGGIWTEGDDSPYRKPTAQVGHMTFAMPFTFPKDTKTLSRDGYRLQTDLDDMNVVEFWSGDGKGNTTYGDSEANNGYEYVIYPDNYKGSVFMVNTDRVPYGKNVFVYAAWDPIITYNMNDGTDTVISDFNYITSGNEYTVLGANGYTAYSSSSSANGREGDGKNTLLPNREGYRGQTQIYSRYGYILAGWNTAPDGSGTAYDVNGVYEITEPLSLYAVWAEDPAHTHEYNAVVLKEANCTDRGRIEYTCGCGKSYIERPLALGHDFDAWRINEDTQSRSCFRCGFVETASYDVTLAASVSVNGYEITLINADKITEISYAPGVIKSLKELGLSGELITVTDIEDSLTMPAAGIYTLALKQDGGSVYLYTVEIKDDLVSADGVTVTVKGLTDAKDFYIAKGDHNSYAEVKANRVVNVTSKKFASDGSYTYVLSTPGIYTVLIRSNDANVAHKIVKINITVTEPEFTPMGLQLHIGNLDGVKTIRTAYGEYDTVSAIKRADGSRAFTEKNVLKGANEYTIQYRENGVATVIVCYNNGYVKVYQFEVKKTVPDFNHEKDTVTIGNLDNLQVIRYASGEYDSASELKRAPDCINFTKHDIVDGVVTVSGLKDGKYTFLVQYKDESYNLYTVEVKPEEPTATGISLSNAFSDNMIVQRDEKLTVWGSAPEESEDKAVIVEFKGERAVGIVNNGIWEAVFDTTFPMDKDGSDITIKAADGVITVKNVLIGDVYYIIGQSNVFYGIGDLVVDRYFSGSVNNTVPVDYNNTRDMRFYRISSTHYSTQTGDMAQGTATVYEDVYNGAQWLMPSDIGNQVQRYAMPFINNYQANDNITCGLHTFSALGYMFAYNMTNRTDVPIGVIEIDASGYPLMAFAPNELAEKWGKDEYDAATGTYYYSAGAVVAPQIKTRFAYNQQIHPLRRFSIAGIIWYQGESDFPNTDEYLGAGASTFREELPELMTYFRKNFGNSDFPVYMVEFPACFAGTANAYMDMGSSRCELGMVPSILENSYVVSSSDLWKTVRWINNIHPPIKDLNAYRLTDIVLAARFGQGSVDDVCGPVVESCEFSGNTVTLTFDHVSTGLKTADQTGIVRGIEVLVNGVWTAVTGDYIRNQNQLVITANAPIMGVRYNRNTSGTFPETINLCNGYNMPAVAFVQYKY